MSNQLTTKQNQAVAKKSGGLAELVASDTVKKRFEEVLGGKRAPAFLSSLLTSVNNNPALQKCEPRSVISAAAIAASLDLPIISSLGLAHIVPYGGVAQFQIGWKGIIQLALRTNQYRTINLTKVLEGQLVRHNHFTGDMEFQEKATSDNVVGYLLFFRLIGGYEKYFYMTVEQCEAHGKKFSKMYQMGKGRWVEDFDAMAMKTVAKMGLTKYGLLSVDLQTAVAADEGEIDEAGQVAKFPDNTDPEPEKLPWESDEATLSAVAEVVEDAVDLAVAKERMESKPETVPWEEVKDKILGSEASGDYVVKTGGEKGTKLKDKSDTFWRQKLTDLEVNKANFPPKVKEGAEELIRALKIYLGAR